MINGARGGEQKESAWVGSSVDDNERLQWASLCTERPATATVGVELADVTPGRRNRCFSRPINTQDCP